MFLSFEPGNHGEYNRYAVLLRAVKGRGKREKNALILDAVFERPELCDRYPCMAFSRVSGYEKLDTGIQYMELRTISNMDGFWLFLNALNL